MFEASFLWLQSGWQVWPRKGLLRPSDAVVAHVAFAPDLGTINIRSVQELQVSHLDLISLPGGPNREEAEVAGSGEDPPGIWPCCGHSWALEVVSDGL